MQIVIRLEFSHNGKIFPRDELLYVHDDATVKYLFKSVRGVSSIDLYDRESKSTLPISIDTKLENNATYLIRSRDVEDTKEYLNFIIKHKRRRLWRDRG